MAQRGRPRKVNGAAAPVPETSEARPPAGETMPGEPTREEIIDAISNEPSRELFVELAGQKIPIVELTQSNWLRYLAVFAPEFEALLKNLLPMLGVATRSYTILRHFTPETREDLRQVALLGDLELLQESIKALGVSEVSLDDLIGLQQAATDGAGMDFLLSMSLILLRPLGGEAMRAMEELSFSKILLRISDRLAELALASLKSSFIRRGLPYKETELVAAIELCDGMDLFDIVYKQYEHDRVKIRRFFGQVMSLAMRNTPTETPSVSTIEGTPS